MVSKRRTQTGQSGGGGVSFGKELRQALTGQKVFPNDWKTTSCVITEMRRVVLSSWRKVNKEILWQDEGL